MVFLLLGVGLLVMKFLEVAPIATLSWYFVLAPFGAAVLWWWYADSSGYTKRREMDKMAQRRDDRIDKQRAAMGMLSAKKPKKK